MDKNQAKVTVKVQTNAYPACIKPAEALIPYIAQFDIDSASCAIFCINSWAANRSFQNSAYALNAAILSIGHFGTKELTSYKSFSEFFSAIQNILPIFPCEDEVIPVMGHTMIPFQERWRKVISGCGATLEYPRLYFADSIIRESDKVEEFGTLLDYIDDMAISLNGGEWREADEPFSELGLPSQEYWERVSTWMGKDPGSALHPDTVRSIDSQATYVENKAFLLHGNQAVPLFCPSLLEDYLNHHIENSPVETIQSRLDTALIEHARLIYDTDGRMGGSVFTYPIFEVGSELIEQCPAIFLVFNGKNRLTLFYNASMRFNADGLLKLRHHFQEKETSLTIVDYAIRQGKHRKLVLKNPSKFNLTIVAYHDNVYLGPSFIGFEERAKNADVECGAADLMAIILMGQEIDEICSFFSGKRKNSKPNSFRFFFFIRPFFPLVGHKQTHYQRHRRSPCKIASQLRFQRNRSILQRFLSD